MTSFGKTHPDVERLQELSNAPINEHNAEEFMIFLEKAFINNSWEQYPEPKRIVDSYLSKLGNINESWADEIHTAIRNSSKARGVLASSIRPKARPRHIGNQIEVGTSSNVDHEHPTRLSDSRYEHLAEDAIHDVENIKNDREVFIFQYYYNLIHADDIKLDGIIGTETTGAILNHIRATQILLKELGANLEINGEIDTKTQKALKEEFGFDAEITLSHAAHSLQEQFDAFNEKSTQELIQELEEIEKLEDRHPYISLLAQRFKKEGKIVKTNSNNAFVVQDENGGILNLNISQENLGAIMILAGVNSSEVVGRTLDSNIPNNIFDAVMEKFDDLKKENGEGWKAQDFIADEVRGDSEVQENKNKCVTQIDNKISELKGIINLDDTPEAQKTELRQWIQKLEIAKAFVINKAIFSENTLKMVYDIANIRKERARLFGNTLSEQAHADGRFEAGDIKNFMISQTPRLIIAGIFALLAKLLPSPFKEAAWAWIGGITGLGMFEDAQDRGIIPEGNGGSLNGSNAPTAGVGGNVEYTDAMRNILTDAPAGLERRHETMYARMVEENNKTETAYFSRQKLDTMFIISSQDYSFGDKSISEIANLNGSNAFDLLSDSSKSQLITQGITAENFLHFVRLLQEKSTDTEDVKIRDLFVIGKADDESNLLDTMWVAGGDFEEQNQTINENILKISGASYGVPESIRGESLRANVEEILSTAQPGFLTWATSSILERADFEDWETTYPSEENIQEIIRKLQALSATGEDKKAIDAIISSYQEIQESLEANTEVNDFLEEARAIYSIPGRATRLIDEGIEWISSWGDPITITNNPAITTASITAIITTGTELLEGSTLTEDKAEQVRIALENLRLYQIRKLDERARDSGLSQTERSSATTESNHILSDAITASNESKALYMNTLENLESDMAELSSTYTSVNEYIRVFNRQKENIATIQRLAALNIPASEFPNPPYTLDFNSRADDLLRSAFTQGFLNNFKAHVNQLETDLSGINITPTTADDLKTSQNAYKRIRDEILLGSGDGFLGDAIMAGFVYFGIGDDAISTFNGVRYYDAAKGMNLALQNLNIPPSGITFDISKLEDTRRALDTTRQSLIGDIETIPDVNNAPWEDSIVITTDTGIDSAISAVQDQLQVIEGVEGADRDKIDEQIAHIVDKFTNQISSLTPVDDTTGDTLESIHERYERFTQANGVKNASGNIFEAAKDRYQERYNEKMKEVTEYAILNVRISSADESIGVILDQIAIALGVSYNSEGNLIEGLLYDGNGDTKRVEYNANGIVISGPYYDQNGTQIPSSGISTHPFYRDIISQVGTTNGVTFVEMFSEINLGLSSYPQSIQEEIQAKQGEIISILAPGIPERSATWIRETYGSVEEYITRFYNTVTQ